MSRHRRMRHVAVDAGDGITAMVRMRGPMTPELNDAFAALARAAAEQLEWPVHQPEAVDAPIPGRHWYSGCAPGGDFDPETYSWLGTGPRVNHETGICEGCGRTACKTCGRENCPDHA